MVGSQLTIRGSVGTERSVLPVVALGIWSVAVFVLGLLAVAVAVLPGGRSVAHALLGANTGIAPHAASGRTLSYALGLLVNNSIVALWPLSGLFLLRDAPRCWRRVFMVVVVLSGLRSVAPLVAAIGLWGQRLLPYIPNVPFELAAITTGGVLYTLRSRQRISRQTLICGVAGAVLLLVIAATLETWAVPTR